MFSMGRFDAKVAASWVDGRIAGEHDEQCELPYRPWVCNCAKRTRKAKHGDKEPDSLYFPSPSCTRCDEDLEYDDDCWFCRSCGIQWGSDGEFYQFTDDMGDLGKDLDRSEWSPVFKAAMQPIQNVPQREPEGRPSWIRDGRPYRCTRCRREVGGLHTCIAEEDIP